MAQSVWTNVRKDILCSLLLLNESSTKVHALATNIVKCDILTIFANCAKLPKSIKIVILVGDSSSHLFSLNEFGDFTENSQFSQKSRVLVWDLSSSFLTWSQRFFLSGEKGMSSGGEKGIKGYESG